MKNFLLIARVNSDLCLIQIHSNDSVAIYRYAKHLPGDKVRNVEHEEDMETKTYFNADCKLFSSIGHFPSHGNDDKSGKRMLLTSLVFFNHNS